LSWDFFVWHSGDPKPVFGWLPERSGALVLKGGITSRLEVLEYGTKAAGHYGDIRADLERKGTHTHRRQ
jgi:hypothetical protein